MQDYMSEIQRVINPLIYAINRHDKLNNLEYFIGGEIIVDAAISWSEFNTVTIFLADISKGDIFYKILKDLGYVQIEQTDYTRRFKNLNNVINVMHFKSFTAKECIINAELLVEGFVIDNSFTLFYHREFFEDINSRTINVIHLHEPSSGIEHRIQKLKDRGFKMSKPGQKVLSAYKRGVDYKKMLKPILPEEIITKQTMSWTI